jgi:plasmid stabilization system protein ParE
MNCEFLPEADEEFREAARYYESEAPGVGLAFITEVHRTISAIAAHPRAATIVRDSIRKKTLSLFPYSLLYSLETDLILIVAVAHHKRRPTYWRIRLQRQ